MEIYNNRGGSVEIGGVTIPPKEQADVDLSLCKDALFIAHVRDRALSFVDPEAVASGIKEALGKDKSFMTAEQFDRFKSLFKPAEDAKKINKKA